MWDATERREQGRDFVDACLHTGRIGRPSSGDNAIPERLWIGRVIEEQPVAEITELSASSCVYHGLVRRQATTQRRVDDKRRQHAGQVSPSVIDAARRAWLRTGDR